MFGGNPDSDSFETFHVEHSNKSEKGLLDLEGAGVVYLSTLHRGICIPVPSQTQQVILISNLDQGNLINLELLNDNGQLIMQAEDGPEDLLSFSDRFDHQFYFIKDDSIWVMG